MPDCVAMTIFDLNEKQDGATAIFVIIDQIQCFMIGPNTLRYVIILFGFLWPKKKLSWKLVDILTRALPKETFLKVQQ